MITTKIRSVAELEKALEECRQRAAEANAAGDFDAVATYLTAAASISKELNDHEIWRAEDRLWSKFWGDRGST